jgi:hypothetical protein
VGQLECLGARLVRVEDELHQAGAVAQVDEDQAAVVAAAVHPPRDPQLGVDAVGQHWPHQGVAVVVRPQCRENRFGGLAGHTWDGSLPRSG